MVLCNQGCKTKVYFKNNVPYNVSDNEPHEKTCMSLRIGKWWGGYYNTIPISRIKDSLETIFVLVRGEQMTFKEMVQTINKLQSEAEYVLRQIKDQEKWNTKQKDEFAVYKTRLVEEQTRREERKKEKIRTIERRDWKTLDPEEDPPDGLQSEM